jgi:hypothetical protein
MLFGKTISSMQVRIVLRRISEFIKLARTLEKDNDRTIVSNLINLRNNRLVI